jgi:tetratricopeptide (TPR) repeat protein
MGSPLSSGTRLGRYEIRSQIGAGGMGELYDWDWAGAEQEFKRAIELNPRYATDHQWYGGYLEAMGRHSEAIAERKRVSFRRGCN